jgi:hypothetical protein
MPRYDGSDSRPYDYDPDPDTAPIPVVRTDPTPSPPPPGILESNEPDLGITNSTERRVQLIIGLVALAVVFAIGILLVPGATNHLDTAAIVWLLIMAVVLADTVIIVHKSRNWLASMPPDYVIKAENVRVGAKEFTRIRPALVKALLRLQREENPHKKTILVARQTLVHWLSRRHWMQITSRLVLLGLLAIGLLIVGLEVNWKLFLVSSGEIAFWWSIVVLPLFCLVGFFHWLLWRYSYFAVTDNAVMLLRVMPAFFWWMKQPMPSIALRKIDNTDKEDTWLGNLFGYGYLTVDGAGDRDKAFHDIRWVPQHLDVRKIITAAMEVAF